MSNYFPVGKVGANKTYADKAACELAEGQACYEISNKSPLYHDVVNGELVFNQAKKDMYEAEYESIAQVALAMNLRLLLLDLAPDGVNLLQSDIDLFIGKLTAQVGE